MAMDRKTPAETSSPVPIHRYFLRSMARDEYTGGYSSGGNRSVDESGAIAARHLRLPIAEFAAIWCQHPKQLPLLPVEPGHAKNSTMSF